MMNKIYCCILISLLTGCTRLPEGRFYDFIISKSIDYDHEQIDNALRDLISAQGYVIQSSKYGDGGWYCRIMREYTESNSDEDWREIYIDVNLKKGKINVTQFGGSREADFTKILIAKIKIIMNHKIGSDNYFLNKNLSYKSILN